MLLPFCFRRIYDILIHKKNKNYYPKGLSIDDNLLNDKQIKIKENYYGIKKS